MNAAPELQRHETSDSPGGEHIITISSWLIVAWTCYVFLGSLPYKFSNHPDTQHIFSTIGEWMTGILGNTIGNLFTHYGAYLVGSVELLISLVLLSPIILWLLNKAKGGGNVSRGRAKVHAIGGAMATMVMAGAVFFHLFTPLGIAVLHNGQSDGGSLFRAAVSILVLGIVLLVINWSRGFGSEVRS